MLIICFLILSLCASLIYVGAAGFVLWKVLLLFIGCFVAVNILFVLFWGAVSLFVDTSRPLSRQSALCRAGCAAISALICEYCNVRAHISGEELLPEGERFLLVCNHRSGFDPLVMMDKLRKHNIAFISKPSNMSIPIGGRLSYGAGFLPIDRENNRNALKTINTAADYLEKDICSMGIFPEGTRTKDGKLHDFHAGSFKIAQKAGAPVVIACVRGTEKVSGNFPRRPTDVFIDILEVLPAEKVKSAHTRELAAYSQGRIAAKIDTEEAEA